MSNPAMNSFTRFLLALDPLKSVNRRSYINGGERLENSAEHSWHLAMACWAFAERSAGRYDMEKLLKLALVHDLGEMGAGDTFLYDTSRKDAHIAERACVAELAAHEGNPIADLTRLWDEQEQGDSPEARLVKVIDRLLPFLHNLASQGRSWQENNVRRSQVAEKHQFIAREDPEVYQWFREQLDHAVAQGWLAAD